jgi:hypothetical protein
MKYIPDSIREICIRIAAADLKESYVHDTAVITKEPPSYRLE